MTTLYEINEAIADVIEQGFHVDEETGEFFDSSSLDQLNVGFGDKAEAVGLYIKQEESDARQLREEEKALAERRRVKECHAERLKGYLLDSILAWEQATGGDRKSLETARFKPVFRRSERVCIDSEDSIPEEFWDYERKLNKRDIKANIKAGIEVPGAHVDECLNVSVR